MRSRFLFSSFVTSTQPKSIIVYLIEKTKFNIYYYFLPQRHKEELCKINQELTALIFLNNKNVMATATINTENVTTTKAEPYPKSR